MREEISTKSDTNLKNLIQKLKHNLVIPLKRSSEQGVAEFLNNEILNYSYKHIGTVSNSIAKKYIEEDLKAEKSEIDRGETADIFSISHTAKISTYLMKSILKSVTTRWCFLTTNSNILKTFHAKSFQENYIEIFISLQDDGPPSYIGLDPKFKCLIHPDTLSEIKHQLEEVFLKLTKNLNSIKLVKVEENLRLERIILEEPDSWLLKKKNALEEFFSEIENTPILSKFFNSLDIYQTFDNIAKDTVTDTLISAYLLDNIHVDIKSIYA